MASNMFYIIEIVLIMVFTSVACALPGVYLVLRKWSMMGDAISHSVLLGIVLAYLLYRDLNSPYLLIGASIFALVSVYCVELLSKISRAKMDSALGITFTFFFSVAVIIVSRFLSNSHIDIDMVLLGEVAFAPLRRITVWGISLPYSLIQMAVICILNCLIIVFLHRGLKVSSFDQNFARVAGFSLIFFQIVLMTMVSFSTVAAFDAVGAVLVVSFLVTPAATAYFFTDRLSMMMLLTAIIAIFTSILGSILALRFNVPYSGAVASVAGVLFFLAFCFNRRGLLYSVLSRRRLKKQFQSDLLILHLYNHREESDPNFLSELGQHSILRHLNWTAAKLKTYKDRLIKEGLVEIDSDNHIFYLTDMGMQYAEKIRKEYGLDII